MRIFSKYLTALFLLGIVFAPTGAWAEIRCGTLEALYSSDIKCNASDEYDFCASAESIYTYYLECLEQWTTIQNAFCCSSCEGTLEMAAENLGLSCAFDAEDDSGSSEGYADVPLNFPDSADSSIYDIAPGDYARCYGDRGPYMVFCDCDTYVADNTYPECPYSIIEPNLDEIDNLNMEFDTCTLNPLIEDGYDSDRRILCVGEKYYAEGLGDNCSICNCGFEGGSAATEGTGEADSDWIAGGAHRYFQRSAQFDAITGRGTGCQSSTTYTYSCDAGYYLIGDDNCQMCPPVEGEVGSSLANTPEYNQSGIISCEVPADLEITDGTGNKYMYVNDCAYTLVN